MIDIHTHILPFVDDGSRSIEETQEMLEIMWNSGIQKVVATPHFYADTMTVEDFLKKRNNSYVAIKDAVPEGMEIFMGAEVMLEYDLHKEDLRKLAIEGTDYILVEMPYNHWDPWVFEEIFKISAKHDLEIIVAHIDRYVDIAGRDNINKLFGMGLKYQVNVDFIDGFFKKPPAVKMLRDSLVHFIASDCHNTTTRIPHLAKSVKKLKSKLGAECIELCMSNAEKMLRNKDIN